MELNELTPQPTLSPMAIRYSLVDGTVPNYISDGGYFKNSVDQSLIGLAYADTYPSVTTEGSIAKLTRSELLNYVLANHANKSYTKQPLDLGNSVEVDMNDAEVTALVTAWCTERSIS